MLHNYLTQVFPDDNIFIDQIKPKAKKWRDENDKNLMGCNLVILILTPAALISPEVKREIKISRDLNKKILPCKINSLKKNWNQLPLELDTDDGIKFDDVEDLLTTLYGEITEIKNDFFKETTISPELQLKPITVNINKQNYFSGETIIINGEVHEIIPNFPITLQIISPEGNLVEIAQLEVDSNKKFKTELMSGGVLWKTQGLYSIKVAYGTASRTVETSFTFSDSKEKIVNPIPESNFVIEGYDNQINFDINNGKVVNISKDPNITSLLLSIESQKIGQIRISIPREILDARVNDQDDDFFVLVDGKEVDFDETKTSIDRTLTIDFPKGSEEIEIIGVPNIGKPLLSPLFKNLNEIKTENKSNIHPISISSSFDRSVYPLGSTVYLRAKLNDIIVSKPIVFEVLNSTGKKIFKKEINPETFPDSELKKEGIYEISFRMKRNDWKLGEIYTLRAKHGLAEYEHKCIVDERKPVIQTDKSAFIWGSDIIITIIDPDADRDSKNPEYVGNRSDSKLIISSSKGKITNYKLRETANSTGIFQGIIGLIGVFKSGKIVGYKIGKKIITKNQGKEVDDGFLLVAKNDKIIFSYRNKIKTTTHSVFVTDFGATVELDQKVYTWTDKVYITVVAPNFNFNSKKIDYIGIHKENQITITTSKSKISKYKLKETGKNTGIFTGEVILSGFLNQNLKQLMNKRTRFGIVKGKGPNDGLITTSNDDFIEVAFNYYGEELIVGRAKIQWNIGEVVWLKSTYSSTETGIVRVVDPDMNLDPNKIDNFKIHVWSDTDPKGIIVNVYETGEATGIFERKILFNKNISSNDGKLRVKEGDTVCAEYIDCTLPPPSSINDEKTIRGTAVIE